MKLAEALSIRKDLQKRIQQLEQRIKSNVKVLIMDGIWICRANRIFYGILGSRSDLPTYGSCSEKLKDARLKYHVARPPGWLWISDAIFFSQILGSLRRNVYLCHQMVADFYNMPQARSHPHLGTDKVLIFLTHPNNN